MRSFMENKQVNEQQSQQIKNEIVIDEWRVIIRSDSDIV